MKVTAILPDDLIKDVKEYTGGRNITDSLLKALTDWLYTKRLEKINRELVEEPFQFKDGYTAESIRNMNNKI